jgi:hypothetical protein
MFIRNMFIPSRLRVDAHLVPQMLHLLYREAKASYACG